MAFPQPSTSRYRLRVVALLGVLIAFDVAFVAAVYVLGHVALGLAPLVAYRFDALFWTMGFDLVSLKPALIVSTPVVLVLQSVFGYRLTLREAREYDIGPDKQLKNIVLANRSGDDDEPEEPAETVVAAPALRQRVARLAQTADVSVPDVSVLDIETPNSYVASRPGERTLFLTVGLLEALDEAELDAVIAHELAHLKNGDAFVMTAAAFLPTVSGRAIDGLVGLLRKSAILHWLLDLDGDDTNLSNFEFPVLLFAPMALPILGAIFLASTACYRLLSRIREYAADAGGVALCGSPAALASALATLTGDPRPETDARLADTGVRELCVLPYALDETRVVTADDRLGWLRRRAHTVSDRLLPGSHPDPETRIATLRNRQADLESE